MDTYEKKYNELVEKLKKASVDNDWCDERFCCVISSLFPEIKEGDDKRMANHIIDIVKCKGYDAAKDENFYAAEIAWLEKQGEPQGKSALEAIKEEKVDNANKVEPKDYSSIDPHFFKPAVKVEPKFHEGDWIVHQGTENIYQVVCCIDNYYQLKYGDNYTIQNCVDVDRCARLWDITKDAKVGDVLSDGTTIFIFKDLLSDGSVMSCCDYDADSGESDAFCPFSVNLMCSKITLATQEQRDLLFSKMKEAGYEWKAETKDLIKLPKPKEVTGVLKQPLDEEKSWSEEDEKMCNDIIRDITIDKSMCKHEVSISICDEKIEWLKQLKYRIGG